MARYSKKKCIKLKIQQEFHIPLGPLKVFGKEKVTCLIYSSRQYSYQRVAATCCEIYRKNKSTVNNISNLRCGFCIAFPSLSSIDHDKATARDHHQVIVRFYFYGTQVEHCKYLETDPFDRHAKKLNIYCMSLRCLILHGT